jgi:hypothetical protein
MAVVSLLAAVGLPESCHPHLSYHTHRGAASVPVLSRSGSHALPPVWQGLRRTRFCYGDCIIGAKYDIASPQYQLLSAVARRVPEIETGGLS